MKLNELRNNPGALKKGRRVGRGEGSGKGKTCGSGQKGQKARTGVSINGFEGGQNPLYRRLPKRGFTNIFATIYSEINVGQLQKFVDAGKLDASKVINKQTLVDAGILSNKSGLIKLLGQGELKNALMLEVDHASKSAIALVEKAKGKVVLPTVSAA
jgi:large subunit ribosomal protein L15